VVAARADRPQLGFQLAGGMEHDHSANAIPS
jgi:hypothetical protein